MRSKIDKIIGGTSGKIYAALLDGVTQDCTPHELVDGASPAALSVQESDDFVPHKFVGVVYRQYLHRYPNKLRSSHGSVSCAEVSGDAPSFFVSRAKRIRRETTPTLIALSATLKAGQ